jgi:hypothetical protein
MQITSLPKASFDAVLLAEAHKVPPEHHTHLLELVRIFRESVMLPSAEDSFRTGWQEAMRGETRPISELREGIDAE